MERDSKDTPAGDGWGEPKPAVLPEPTYSPAILALGIVFFAWGLIVTWMLSVVGLVLMFIALIGWIRAILADEAREVAHGAKHD